MKRLTQKYRLALETAQLHGIYAANQDQLYAELQKRFTWYPALKQWLSNDQYFREEWGILPAFWMQAGSQEAQERGFYKLYELHQRAKTANYDKPDAVLRWTGSINRLFQIKNARPYLYHHPEYGDLPCYRYWDHLPKYLKTKTQIRQTDKKRRPKQPPKAVVDTTWEDGRYERGGVYLLYDIRECLDKKPPTEAQTQAFQKVRAEHTCRGCGQTGIIPTQEGLCPRCQKWRDKERAFETMLVQERNRAILWAQELLQTGFVVLDTETTGLDGDARIVDIAIIDGISGDALVETLLNPEISIPPEASAIHGIYDADVQDKPTFQEIRADVEAVLSDKLCVIYNEAYDKPLLKSHGMNTKQYRFDCAMEMYAQFRGEWSDYWKGFRWQSLTAARAQCHLDVSKQAHRALGDCQATRALIVYMAQQ